MRIFGQSMPDWVSTGEVAIGMVALAEIVHFVGQFLFDPIPAVRTCLLASRKLPLVYYKRIGYLSEPDRPLGTAKVGEKRRLL